MQGYACEQQNVWFPVSDISVYMYKGKSDRSERFSR